jgi:hypothetical protein
MHCAQQTTKMIRAFVTILFIYQYKQRTDEEVEALFFPLSIQYNMTGDNEISP